MTDKDRRISELARDREAFWLELHGHQERALVALQREVSDLKHDLDEAQRRRDLLLDRIRVLEMADKNRPTAPADPNAPLHRAIRR